MHLVHESCIRIFFFLRTFSAHSSVWPDISDNHMCRLCISNARQTCNRCVRLPLSQCQMRIYQLFLSSSFYLMISQVCYGLCGVWGFWLVLYLKILPCSSLFSYFSGNLDSLSFLTWYLALISVFFFIVIDELVLKGRATFDNKKCSCVVGHAPQSNNQPSL